MEPRCPICHEVTCPHWIGWTEDGTTIVPTLAGAQLDPSTIQETDTIYHAGLTRRVYRRVYSGVKPKPAARR